MSVQTINPRQQPKAVPATAPIESPPLNAGDRLSRAEFERRYQANPAIKKAELVEGIVYMPSPTRYEKHANPHFVVITWLGTYWAATSGVEGGDNATLRLDFENETQPDALLRLDPTLGGQSVVTADDYLEGAPELIVEIAASSASYDLYDKRRAYARNGVQEYLVFQTYEKQVDWFALREGVYETLTPDENGILRSEVFPGLWLQPAALWSGDLAALLAVLQAGLASADQLAFVEKLKRSAEEQRTE